MGRDLVVRESQSREPRLEWVAVVAEGIVAGEESRNEKNSSRRRRR
ncbi:hypothetical protein TIFTF001_053524 [Ficus carica]|uniref:Uncharacterized protein n=1 Tax=Ficus carica TaxID=3494 RepID=A0AA88ECQ3_FICCA|nr:hypothetical protein TIFTF001_053524 [Ficus carica]